MAKTKKHYDALMESAVEKFSPDDVNYRDSEDKHQCRNCVHFLLRKVDQFGLCEVVRPDGDEAIDEDYVCNMWTKDGKFFPLLK